MRNGMTAKRKKIKPNPISNDDPTEENREWVEGKTDGVEIAEKSKSQNEQITYKYSYKGRDELREAVIIEKKPYFIKYSVNVEKEKDYILCEPKIQQTTRTLRPPYEEEYPYDPYEFFHVNE